MRPGSRWPLERRESGLKDLLYVGGGAGGVGGCLWRSPGQLQVSLPPSAAGRPRHSMGVGKEKRKGMHQFLRRRSAEPGARAWFLRVLLQLRNRTHGESRAGGGANSGPCQEGRTQRAKPSLSPPLWAQGCQVSCLERKRSKIQGGKTGRRKERAWWGLAAAGERCPSPGLSPALPSGQCPPLAFGRGDGPAGCARPLICRAGGGRAGGLGAVCNFAASVAAVPGERAPALAPIGRRRVSWCDLLLSLLAFGHPETNQFDDY